MVDTQRPFPRLEPAQAALAAECGGLVIDLRREPARTAQGEIPGALVVAGALRSWRTPEGARVCDLGRGLLVIVVCTNGQSSLLVASALYGLGVTGATDVVGGFDAWSASGLPVTRSRTPVGQVVPRQRRRDPLPAAVAVAV